MSLQTRFIISVTILILLLVVIILAVIEQRERRVIFEEQKNKGILIAKYIAQMNSYPLQIWDEYGVQKSVDEQINENLVFVIFYDRYKNPWVANDFIKAYEHIYLKSHLDDEADREEHFCIRNKLEDKKSGRILRILEIEIPIYANGLSRRSWSVKIGYSLKEMLLENQRTRLMLILFGLGGLLLGILGAILLSKRITGPLKKLVEGTVKISRGDFLQKIPIVSGDEIGNLAQSFNDMSRQLQLTKESVEETNRKLIQAEKLASIGRISASIAHEIRNPLTSVKLNMQKVQESKHLDEMEREHLGVTQEGIDQIEKFIKELLNYTRITQLNKTEFSIEQVLDESIKMMADSMELKNITIKKNYQTNLPHIWIDGDKLRQVFLNVLHNSYEAVEPGGEIYVSVSLESENEKNMIRIVFADNGIGIPEKDWENIFEPFYTTKSSGIGLGLANARKIIEHHQGKIKVKKKDGKGSMFEILIPFEGEP